MRNVFGLYACFINYYAINEAIRNFIVKKPVYFLVKRKILVPDSLFWIVWVGRPGWFTIAGYGFGKRISHAAGRLHLLTLPSFLSLTHSLNLSLVGKVFFLFFYFLFSIYILRKIQLFIFICRHFPAFP